jgi:hypothetical protein
MRQPRWRFVSYKIYFLWCYFFTARVDTKFWETEFRQNLQCLIKWECAKYFTFAKFWEIFSHFRLNFVLQTILSTLIHIEFFM